MAFGIPNASDLNGIITNLGTIVASLGPEETAVLNAAILQLSDHADALEDKAIAAAKALEDPLLARIDAATAVAATLTGILQQVVDHGLMLTVPKVTP